MGDHEVDETTLSIGLETAFVAPRGRARLVFGLGPPRGGRSPLERGMALCAALDLQRICWCEQVHGRCAAWIGRRTPGSPPGQVGGVGRCDALITSQARVGLLVWTADCVPVLLAGDRVVAAVHAGWRGVGAGIVSAVARRLEREAGAPLSELVAVLGPAIGPCHYLVGEEVVRALALSGVPAERWLNGRRVDLRALVAAELEQLGLARENVLTVGGCTACTPASASFRRDGEAAGRQASLVYLAE